MDLIEKALWFVESHSREEISLENIAEVCQVSTYHLTRAFSSEKGISLMRYVRARRLSEAAKKLITTQENILDVAIEFGYGSHEAFTRAFRDQFQVPPGILKSAKDLTKIKLVEAFTMKESSVLKINEPRIEELTAKTFVGLHGTYDCNAPSGIPDQWQSFSQYLGHIDGQLNSDAFGICYNFDEKNRFDYLTCVEVSHPINPGLELISFQLKANRYAVFSHPGHVSEIRSVFSAIWNQWFMNSKFKSLEAPNLEKYGKNFDPRTGKGGFEIWIPIE